MGLSPPCFGIMQMQQKCCQIFTKSQLTFTIRWQHYLKKSFTHIDQGQGLGVWHNILIFSVSQCLSTRRGNSWAPTSLSIYLFVDLFTALLGFLCHCFIAQSIQLSKLHFIITINQEELLPPTISLCFPFYACH